MNLLGNVLGDHYPVLAPGNVRAGVDRGDGTAGTLALPAVGNVRSGIAYGAGGTEFVGTLLIGGGVGPLLPAYSPATIVARFLTLSAITSAPEDGQEWPAYVGHEPPEPPNCVTVYDTGGTLDGREMRTGEVLEHPGVQVRVRADPESYAVARAKAEQVVSALNGASRAETPFADASFALSNASQASGIAYLGPEPETRRPLFTVNYRVTLEKLET